MHLKALQAESLLVQDKLVNPGWNGELHGLPRTLYGYMMNCFTFIDLLSQYRQGSTSSQGQTKRMVAFMDDYLGYDPKANKVAVKLWRHTLMHTANPEVIWGEDSEIRYWWLLHWGPPYLPIEQHMHFQNRSTSEEILGVGLSYLISDVGQAAERLFRDAHHDVALQAKVETAHAQLLNPKDKYL